jgi:hypothetical protein
MDDLGRRDGTPLNLFFALGPVFIIDVDRSLQFFLSFSLASKMHENLSSQVVDVGAV